MKRKDFQLGLLGLLGAGMAPATPPPSTTVTVDAQVLEGMVSLASELIRSDKPFIDAVSKHLRLRKGAEPGPDEVNAVVQMAVDVASSRLRGSLGGREFDSPFGLALELLKSVVEGQIRAISHAAGAADQTASTDELVQNLATAVTESLGLMEEVKRMSKDLPPSTRKVALDYVGRAVLEGLPPAEAYEGFLWALREHYAREALRRGREQVLDFCRLLFQEGRLFRYELEEIGEGLKALEAEPLDRGAVERLILSLALRAAGRRRVTELRNPWEVSS